MNKVEIRKSVLSKRNHIENSIKELWDSEIFKKFINSDLYKKAKDIFIYVSVGSEVDTKNIIKKALLDNKNIYVPKTNITDKEMIAVRINSLDDLSVDKLGILEPQFVDETLVGNKFDLIVVPGIAFDLLGNRIGYGGGYYDKYMDKYCYKVNLLALAYSFQIVPKIIAENHDIKIDYIMSEKEDNL